MMQIKEIMAREVRTIRSEEYADAAARKMGEFNVGCLVVVSGAKVAGIITDRDLTVGCLSVGHEAQQCPVSLHMSSPAVFADPLMDILAASDLMTANRIKRLPVVEEDRLVGLVSFSDIANSMIQPILHLFVGMGASRRAN